MYFLSFSILEKKMHQNIKVCDCFLDIRCCCLSNKLSYDEFFQKCVLACKNNCFFIKDISIGNAKTLLHVGKILPSFKLKTLILMVHFYFLNLIVIIPILYILAMLNQMIVYLRYIMLFLILILISILIMAVTMKTKPFVTIYLEMI